jgi:CTP:molybdopterin cytidylyltransferase MocA
MERAGLMLVDAIVTAGGIPKPDEPLYAYTQGKPKALLEIAGRPMLQWILDALGGARTIRRVVVIGLDEHAAPLTCAKTLGFLPSQGSMLGNLVAGARWMLDQDPNSRHALMVSSDIPAITSESVDWNVNTSLETDDEIYYSVIPQAAMEARFPGSRRSYFKFKDATVTAGDMNLVATSLITHIPPAMEALIEARKNIFQQAAIIGFDTLFKLATRQLTLKEAEQTVSRRLKVRGRLLLCPHAEAGMDVDKPAQYELMKRDLETRARA